MRYVSLHTHSTFSYGDGYGTVAQHVSRVVELGMTAVALTEHGNVSSWVQLEKACRGAEIKPIFGIEIYHADPWEKRKCHMTLLAMNSVGLENINRMVTESYKTLGTTSRSRFPTVHPDVLKEFSDGVIALSGCADSWLSCELLGGKSFGDKRLQPSDRDFKNADRTIRQHQEIFGDRYYLEVQRFPRLDRTCSINPAFAKLSAATGALLVATSDVHYPLPNQNAIQKILHAAHRGGSVESVEAEWEYDVLLTYPESDTEVITDLERTGLTTSEAIGAVDNTAAIAERCNATLKKAPPPRFAKRKRGEEKFDSKALLKQWILEGWHHRRETNEHMQEHLKEYGQRVRHEYEIICGREGFADYFLMVADLVRWAKDNGIAVGPGRGSSVGSLVCYLLSITEIDSMQFPVLFERFMDPTRIDPPDIDIDFDDERRDEVFAYAAREYGADKVANIGTVTRYKGRNSLDDVGRVHHIPNWKLDTIKSKLLERAEGHPRFSKSLEDTYNSFTDVSDLVAQTPELRYAARLEGNIRNFGVHAAGMVISSVPINEICATYEKRIGERQGSAIAFDKYDAAYLGLLKIDALSLSTLGMISKVCELAKFPLTELYRIPLTDKRTLEAFARGDVLGIFQFEGITTRRILKDVAPTEFMQLSDVNALARPGAQDREYVLRRNTPGIGDYFEGMIPVVREHLSWTYGVVVYEEQILMILRDLGGFAPAELNRMRKIIHDKLGGTVFNEYFERFTKGAAAQGITADVARGVWDSMVNASGYAFNIAHSVSYALIGYWCQYLKINYTPQFYTALLLKNEELSDAKERDVRRAKIIQEAERHDIEVWKPDLVMSQENWSFKSVGSRSFIVAGFSSIPSLGPKRVASIMDWRREEIKKYGPYFLDIEDLKSVSGIGPKTVGIMKEFMLTDPDPFKVGKTKEVLEKVRTICATGESGILVPTHVSVDVPSTFNTRQLVVWTGIIRKRKYYDAAEQLSKREVGVSYEDAYDKIKDPHLLKYAALYAEDEYGEQVRIGVSRWAYKRWSWQIEHAVIDRDCVVVQGFTSDFQGISIQAKRLWIVDPFDD